jgi:hypothetical protein
VETDFHARGRFAPRAMSGPHDRFIRYVLEHSERATALLRTVLPPGLAARVRWSTLRGQSRVERRMAARMRQYVSRLLDRWEQQHRRSRHPPLILPVVLYHGPQGPWTAPRSVEC